MSTPDISADALIAKYREENIPRVKLAYADLDGVHRGKYVSLDKFASIAGGTAGFCDCVLGWDVNDQLYDNAKFTGWHTAFPDAKYRIDLATERRLPDEDNTPLFILDFEGDDGGLKPGIIVLLALLACLLCCLLWGALIYAMRKKVREDKEKAKAERDADAENMKAMEAEDAQLRR